MTQRAHTQNVKLRVLRVQIYWVSGYNSRSGRYYIVWDSEIGVERDRFDLFIKGTTREAQSTMIEALSGFLGSREKEKKGAQLGTFPLLGGIGF